MSQCQDCNHFSAGDLPGKYECRLNPPTMVTQYTAVYTVVRPATPACAQLSKAVKNKPAKKKKAAPKEAPTCATSST